jgi:hypothetical protein
MSHLGVSLIFVESCITQKPQAILDLGEYDIACVLMSAASRAYGYSRYPDEGNYEQEWFPQTR